MLTRKDFLGSTLAGLAALLGFGTSSAGCGGDDDGGGGSSGGGGCSASISANHGHSLSVSQADVDAAQTKSYSIKGSSAHDHEVTLTAGHFADLKGGKTVFAEASEAGSGHTHNVSVKCA